MLEKEKSGDAQARFFPARKGEGNGSELRTRSNASYLGEKDSIAITVIAIAIVIAIAVVGGRIHLSEVT